MIIDFRSTKERGVKRMCPPIKKILGKQAIDILNTFGNPNHIPIDLKSILENIGISALPMNFDALEKKFNQKHILGLVLANKSNAVIYYSEKDTLNRQRFTIAHEIGHICKHLKPETNDYPYIDWRIEENCYKDYEIEANTFAGELLIPIQPLKKVYLSMTFPNSIDLAKSFGVSINVMEERLKSLGINYYDEKGQAVINERE